MYDCVSCKGTMKNKCILHGLYNRGKVEYLLGIHYLKRKKTLTGQIN